MYSNNLETSISNKNIKPNHFVRVSTLVDTQAFRCAEFHPNGKVYAVGSNSKTLRICHYTTSFDVRQCQKNYEDTVLYKRTKHHKGSIYCTTWSADGELIATGSNDKSIKLMRFNEMQNQLEGREIELNVHDGTVRDLCFIEDSLHKSKYLISGGAGNCKLFVTDCTTSTPVRVLSGHEGHILSLYKWDSVTFASGSQDKTVRIWDLRINNSVKTIMPITNPESNLGCVVTSVCVDPSGRLLISGHEDSACVLYDLRGKRQIQKFQPHSADIRCLRFSPSAYYLLSCGYDGNIVLTDLQGDLTNALPSLKVAEHNDKVISVRWHPTDFSFLSTSADKTSVLWSLPQC